MTISSTTTKNSYSGNGSTTAFTYSFYIPTSSDIEVIDKEFKMIKRIYDNVASIDPKFRVLSIGMSDDYNIAIENGSTMIRVGSKIFGKRNY